MTRRTFSMYSAVAATLLNPLNLEMNQAFEGQLVAFFEGCPDLRGYESYALPNQSVGAILALPILEMACGFPMVPIYDIGRKEVVGSLDLGAFRHGTVRPRRSDLPQSENYPGYTVIDGAGRGLTELQSAELKALLGSGDIRVIQVPTGHMDFADPTKGIVEALLESGITFEDLTSGRCLYLPAGMGLAAMIQATAIYGLAEVWPRTIRLNRRSDNQFHIDEIVDPQGLKQFGMHLAAKWNEAKAMVMLSGSIPETFRAALEALAAEHGVEIRG